MESAAVFWLVVAASTTPFIPGKIGPMTQERCEKAAQALGSGECRRAIGMMTCSLDGRPGSYGVCPVFEGDIAAPTAR